MIKWVLKFIDPAIRSEEVRAVGYKLLHEGLILSFFDDHGAETFACPLGAVRGWHPAEPPGGPLPQVASTPSPQTSVLDSGRSVIEQQARAAAAHQAPEGRLVAAG
ncbi:hypothetical protein ACIBEJ_00950 [Nonomuraea sp. NPDC050790]|uniref:hypothetical protein n=1 Tax=Nonomuraea sp. NPDC050790 TaxID=3364371 RepID=UPI0037AF6B81